MGRHGSLTRRRFIQFAGTAGAVFAGRVALAAPAAAQVTVQPIDAELWEAADALLKPDIVPRSEWGPDLTPVGRIDEERPDDVRFLLCHHTAQPNNYSEASIDRWLSDIYRFHTSPDKGWPDIAYNFLVDRFGGIWEGRTGSIDAPVKGSATGGSQGFALLCCWLGNHHEEAPTPEARLSMEKLLAWLGHRYDIDTAPDSTAEFVSRGSQLHRKGADVITTTIAGHRDMSATVCPGDFAYPMVIHEFPTTVTSLRNAAVRALAPTTTTSTTTRVTTSTSAVATTTTAAATTTTSAQSNTTEAPAVAAPSELESAVGSASGEDAEGSDIDWATVGAVGAGAAAISAAMWMHQREAAQ